MQSSTLWSRPIGLEGAFGRFRELFPPGWLDAPRTSELGLLNSGLYLLLLAAMFGIYWAALRHTFRRGALRAEDGRGAFRVIFACAALALFVLLWVPGSLSADLHSYAWYGRVWALYGDNPFLHAPAEYAARVAQRAPGGWLDLVYWPDVPSVYGPVWVWVAGAVAWAAHLLGDGLTLHILGHKVVAGIAHLANIVLLWHVAGRWTMDDGRWAVNSENRKQETNAGRMTDDGLQRSNAVAVTLAYAWNPLLLIEFGANGHNDVIMLTGVLGGVLLHLTGRWRLAVVVLAAACMVKVAALLFLIGYVLRAPVPTQRPVAARCLMAASALAVGAVGYLPFWQGTAVLEPLWGGPAATLFTNSLAAMLRYSGAEWVQPLAGQDAEAVRTMLEGPLRLAALALTLGVAAVWLGRVRSFPGLVAAWGWTLFAYLTVGAVWFWPWYVSWLVVPAALAGSARLLNAAKILCFTSMVLYAIYPQLPDYVYGLVHYRSLLVVAPALVYAVASWYLTRNSKLKTQNSKLRQPSPTPPATASLPGG